MLLNRKVFFRLRSIEAFSESSIAIIWKCPFDFGPQNRFEEVRLGLERGAFSLNFTVKKVRRLLASGKAARFRAQRGFRTDGAFVCYCEKCEKLYIWRRLNESERRKREERGGVEENL